MEFIDLKAQYGVLKESIDNNIKSVIESASFINGSYVELFEKKLAEYIGRKYCISCGNGTDALQLAYMAYGVGTGDAVFCPDMTFIASVEPACMLGAKAVFCDIEANTYNIDPVSLEQNILKVKSEGKLNPKAVVAVDFLGNPAKHEEISRICKKYNLVHIEDGAQSTGAIYHGRKCGSFGDISTTSFFPSKPLGCYGDGGAVLTDDERIANIIKSLKVHGRGPKGKYFNIRIGMNSRLDTIQAAVLIPKLDVLSCEVVKRQSIARRYDEALRDIVQVPKIENDSVSAYAQYCILLKDGNQRDLIMKALKDRSIPSLIYYPNVLHTLEVFEPYGEVINSNSKEYAERNLGLPFSPYLREEDQDLIITTIVNTLKES